MTRELVGAAGPECNHKNTYRYSTNSDPNALLTIVSSPAPSNGTYRWKGTGNSQDGGWLIHPKLTPTVRIYAAFLLPQLRVSGTLSPGDAFHILALDYAGASSDIEMVVIYASASTYKLQWVVRTSGTDVAVVTSTNAFATGTDYSVRVVFDNNTWYLWVNGTVEGSGINGDHVKPTNGAINLAVPAGMVSGQSWLMTQPRLYFYDSPSERPGFPCGAARLDPTGNTSESGFNSQVGGCLTDNGDFANWDDYAAAGAPDDATTYNCGQSGVGELKEVSSLSTWTIPSGQVVTGVMHRLWQAASGADKTISTFSRVKYSTSAVETQLPNLAYTTWDIVKVTNPVTPINAAPGGGAITQTVIDGLEAGVRIPSGNGANAYVSANCVEVFSETDDPEPSGATATVQVGQMGTAIASVEYLTGTGVITKLIIDNPTDQTVTFGARDPATTQEERKTALPYTYAVREVAAAKGLIYNTTTRPTEFSMMRGGE